jgi:pyridoxal/pyridoxine/pyridoxamine kinase
MIINFDSKAVTIKAAIPAVAAVTTNISEVEVLSVQDNCEDTVVAFVKIDDKPKRIILWQGADYQAIGDWTQEQANERIIELL